jgi:hypothetical protein
MSGMRALGLIVVICLVAATGVQPASPRGFAADLAEERGPAADQPSALPASGITRAAVARAAPHTTRAQLPAFAIAAGPALPRVTGCTIAGATRHGLLGSLAQLSIRSARGPPAR